MTADFDPYYKWLGIPPKDQPPNHYRLLGIELFESDPQVIEMAADRQMKHVRTFQSGPQVELSQRILGEISAARLCLLKPSKKDPYDAALRESLGATSPVAADEPTGESAAAFAVSDVPSRWRGGRNAWKTPAALGATLVLLAVCVALVVLLKDRLFSSPPGSENIASTNPEPEVPPEPEIPPEQKPKPPPEPAAPPEKVKPPEPAPPREEPPKTKTKTKVKPGPRRPPAQPVAAGTLQLICERLAAKQAPRGLSADVATTFTAPPGEGRSGANGLIVPPIDAWSQQGTKWTFTHERSNDAAGIQIVHPYGTGHVLIHVGQVVMGLPGRDWGRMGWGRDPQSWELETTTAYRELFPLSEGELFRVVSELTAAGEYRLYINERLVAESIATQPEPLNLKLSPGDLPPGVSRRIDFAGEGLPGQLKPGEAALIVGPCDTGKNLVNDVRLGIARIPTVDLLTKIDPARDGVRGEWKLAEGQLTLTAASEGRGLLRLPVSPADEYSIQLKVEPLDAEEDAPRPLLVVGLVCAGKNVNFVLDQAGGAGLDRIDGEGYRDNPAFFPPGQLSPQSQKEILCTATRTGIRVDAGGRILLQWIGDVAELSAPSDWSVGEPLALFIGADRPVRITALTFGPPLALPQPPKSSMPGGDALLVAKKVRAPDEAEIEAARTKLKGLFREELSAAKKADAKGQLASKLLALGRDTEDDAASQYVTFLEARDLAVDAGKPGLTFEVIDQIVEGFEVNETALKADAISKLSKKIPAGDVDGVRLLLGQAAATADEALAVEMFDEADECARAETAAASKLKDTTKTADARRHTSDIKEVRKQADAAAAGLKTLETSPDDAAAHRAVGKYLCFVRDDWPAGIPHLLASGPASLAAAARLEQTPPETAAAQLALANAWYEAAGDQPVPERPQLQIRARHWYQTAVADLTGLDKQQAEKRIAELSKVAGRAGRSTKLPTGAVPGLVGRLKLRSRDTGLVFHYTPGKSFSHEKIADALLKSGGQTRIQSPRIDFLGVLDLSGPMTVEVAHNGGSLSGGYAELYIDGNLIGEVGDDRAKDVVYDVPLDKGLHTVGWIVRGGQLGSDNRLSFKEKGSQNLLPVYTPRAVLAEVRAANVRDEIKLNQN